MHSKSKLCLPKRCKILVTLTQDVWIPTNEFISPFIQQNGKYTLFIDINNQL
jgi:hypothetical protein